MEIDVQLSQLDELKNKIVKANIEFEKIILYEGNKFLIPNYPFDCICEFNKINNSLKDADNVVKINIKNIMVEVKNKDGYVIGKEEKKPVLWTSLNNKDFKKLKWIQKQTWIQKDNNLRWLIALVVGTGVAIFGIISASNK